jgi:hypothetical protein
MSELDSQERKRALLIANRIVGLERYMADLEAMVDPAIGDHIGRTRRSLHRLGYEWSAVVRSLEQ